MIGRLLCRFGFHGTVSPRRLRDQTGKGWIEMVCDRCHRPVPFSIEPEQTEAEA